MFNRPNFSMGVMNNPLVDSPYILQFDVGVSTPPPPPPPVGNLFLLLDNTPFKLLDGTNLLLL